MQFLLHWQDCHVKLWLTDKISLAGSECDIEARSGQQQPSALLESWIWLWLTASSVLQVAGAVQRSSGASSDHLLPRRVRRSSCSGHGSR